MTDIPSRLAAALHDLDRLGPALRRAFEDAYSPLQAIRYDADHRGGEAPVPEVANRDLLNAYCRSARQLERAQVTARLLGWPTRAVWKARIPEPWMLDGAIAILRGAVQWPPLSQHHDIARVERLCGEINGAWMSLPPGTRTPPRPKKARPDRPCRTCTRQVEWYRRGSECNRCTQKRHRQNRKRSRQQPV